MTITKGQQTGRNLVRRFNRKREAQAKALRQLLGEMHVREPLDLKGKVVLVTVMRSWDPSAPWPMVRAVEK